LIKKFSKRVLIFIDDIDKILIIIKYTFKCKCVSKWTEHFA